MTTELRAALNEAFEKESNDEVQTPAEVQSPTQVETPDPVQPEDKAAPDAEREGAPAKVDTAPAETQKPDPASKKVEEAAAPGQHRVDRAPASWKKEAKGEWAALPLQARQEIHRREMEVQRVLQDTTQARQEVQQYREVVTPFLARIQSLGVTPHQAISMLLSADYSLATGTPQQKAKFIDKLLQDYGVDIAELDAAISARLNGAPQTPTAQQGFDPNQISQLVQQQLNQALAPLYQQQRQTQQAQQVQVTQTVEQMALDPKYPHFEEVRQDMADLVEFYASKANPLYLSLDEAYSRAISMRPDLSAMTQAIDQNKKAQLAAQAALSVSGSPVGGGNQSHASEGNLRSDIEAAFGGARV